MVLHGSKLRGTTNMKTLILLTSFFTLTCFGIGSTTTTKQIKNINGSFTSDNTIYNSGFELGSGGWTASGGTFSTTTTAANVGRGSVAGSFDGSAAAQTLTSSAITIPAGLYGKNAVISCNVQGASATLTVAAWDGSANLSVATPITSQATYARTSVNFIAPTSGTVAVQFKTVAVNEPIIYIDDCYIGAADTFNISQVSQATYVGSIKWAGTSSCSWSTSSASFANFAADADCPTATVDGLVTAPGTKIPAAVITNAQPGVYVFVAQGQLINSGSAGVCNIRFSDGTSNFGSGTLYGSASQNMTPLGLEGPVTYTTTQSSLTVNIQGRAEAGTCNLSNDVSGREQSIAVYRYPLTSELAVRPEQSNFGWTAYTPTYVGLGTVTSSTANYRRVGDNLELRGTLTTGTVTAATVSVSLPTGLTTATTPIIQATQSCGQVLSGQTGSNIMYVICPAASATLNFSVQNGSNFATNTVLGTNFIASSTLITWDATVAISGWNANQNAPILVGSVTSGSPGAERLERAKIEITGATCIVTDTSLSGWITCTRTSTGRADVTFAAGLFSATPACAGSGESGSRFVVIQPTSTTAGFFSIYAPPAGDFVNEKGRIMCMGPR